MELPPQLRKHFPFSPHFFSLKKSGPSDYRLHYIDEGRGDPLVCLHGNPTWSFFYRNLIGELKDQHRVLALDHLGCGLSDRPEDFSYRLSDHIENLTNLIEHLGLENITLVVHDWGGAIGLGWAVQNAAKVKRLIIMNTAAFLSQDIPKRIALLKFSPLRDLLIRRLNLFCLGANLMASHRGLSRDLADAYLFPYRSYRDRIAVSCFVKDIPLKPTHPTYDVLKNIEEKLPSLKVPTLLLWGAKDFCFHTGFLDRWKYVFPHAESLVMEEAGHYLLEDEPVLTLERIRKFLS
ncbi:MAG: alpha/beta fold hydrolase [Deltaproteobacteria bacterium]|nr:alpha/beta fold hydrolase [Deltaproteobacteria bacterium]